MFQELKKNIVTNKDPDELGSDGEKESGEDSNSEDEEVRFLKHCRGVPW